MNVTIITGRLGRDFDVKFSPQGKAIAKTSIAVDVRKGKERGTKWYNATIWGAQGEAAAKHMTKGDGIEIVGHLEDDEYTDRDGNKKVWTELVVDRWEFGPKRADKQEARAPEPAQNQGYGNNGTHQPHHSEGRGQQSGGQSYQDPPFDPDEELPF